MSAFGTKRTCSSSSAMSAFEGKADITLVSVDNSAETDTSPKCDVHWCCRLWRGSPLTEKRFGHNTTLTKSRRLPFCKQCFKWRSKGKKNASLSRDDLDNQIRNRRPG